MQIATPIARSADVPKAGEHHFREPLLLRLLNLLAAADNRYRQKQKLKNLPDVRLQDMGMTRRDADLAFSRHSAKH